MTDAELVAAWRDSHDDAAFTELVNRFASQLRLVLLKKGVPETIVEDAVQDALIKAWERVHALRDDRRVGEWLFKVASNRARDQLRSPRWGRSDELPEELGACPDTSGQLAVRETLAQLSADERAILHLVYIEGHTHREAADLLGVSLSAAKMRASRARGRFQLLHSG